MIAVLYFLQTNAASGPVVPVQQTSLALWLAFLTPVCVAVVGLINAMAMKMANAASHKAAAASQIQTQKLTEIHTLVNNDHGVSLRLAASALRRVADMTKDPGDIQAALDAKAASDDHDAKQKIVDAVRAREAIPATLAASKDLSQTGG
jgi:hypothetical protein